MNLAIFQNQVFKSRFFILFLLLSCVTPSFANNCEDLVVEVSDSSIKISGLTASAEIVKIYDVNRRQVFECSANCSDEIILSDLSPGEYYLRIQMFDEDRNEICSDAIDVIVGDCVCPLIFAPVCGVNGKTYGNSCQAACAGVEVIYEGECKPVTTCDLLAVITFNPDLCSQCLTEIAVFSYKGTSYLVSLVDTAYCVDGLTTVVDCDTGEEFCLEGGIAGFSCGDFFEQAEKIEIVLEDDCTPCVCPAIYDPVCGADGKTYGNACEAECAGVAVVFNGSCEDCIGSPNEDILCTQEYDPVCGCDGKTYSNACVAEQAGVKDWTAGPCDCICPKIWDPVCGADGKTYGNACEAACAGVEVNYEGECEGKDCASGNCALLEVIRLRSDLCAQCIREIATYCYKDKIYLVQWADNINCADVLTLVWDCETGERFCAEGGITGLSCGDFFEIAEKLETIVEQDCKCFGPSTPGAPCPEIYDPVCGCDGETYGNDCFAQSSGIKEWTPGECRTGTLRCGDEITIKYGNGKIKMSGLADQHYFFQVHDKNKGWAVVFDCSYECGSEQTAVLPPGEYYVKVHDADWNRICEVDVNLDGNEPGNGLFNCGDAVVTYGKGTVKLEGDPEKSYHMKVLDSGYRDVFACMWQCGSTIVAENIPSGKYRLRIMDADYKIICEESITLINEKSNNNTKPIRQLTSYPNPATHEYFINLERWDKPSGHILVVNTYGQIVDQKSFKEDSGKVIRLDVSAYPKGLYYYQVQMNNGRVFSDKFLVSRL